MLRAHHRGREPECTSQKKVAILVDSPFTGGFILTRMRDRESHHHLFTIGEFSKITALTVKALRFYHEQGLLLPALVDSQTSYRYYDQRQIEAARVIAYLRTLELPVDQIKELLQQVSDEDQLLDNLERHKSKLEEQIRQLRQAVRSLDRFLSEERQAQTMMQSGYEVQEKQLDPMLVAGIRMRGRYSDCGKGFARIGRAMGRFICGKPFLLHFDDEYKEDNADFEVCMAVRHSRAGTDISVRELSGGRCACLLHKGPYDQLGRSYAKILKYVKDRGYHIAMPTREVYLKGPGMIFRGNPENYLTEIQMLIEGNETKKETRNN
jgi:DNA-binding transcriptional MerR regulator/effector-binding domain-containing protein